MYFLEKTDIAMFDLENLLLERSFLLPVRARIQLRAHRSHSYPLSDHPCEAIQVVN